MAKYRKFGLRIRRARIEAKLEADDVAKSTGLKPGYYHTLELGRYMVSLRVLAALCRVLRINANELLPVLNCKSAPIESALTGESPEHRYTIKGPNSMFAQALTEARQARRLTPGQVARSVGCDPLTYYAWETGRSLPRIAFFASLWHCLDFNANRLLVAVLVDSQSSKRRGTNRNTTVKYEAFGSWLRAARMGANLERESVAEAINLSRWHYRRVELGYDVLSLRSMASLRRFLRIDANELLSVLDWKSAPITNASKSKARKERVRKMGEHRRFARLLVSARLARDWTREQVARSIGCSIELYTRWESGRALPNMANFTRLWHCLGFDANRLLDAALANRPGSKKQIEASPYLEIGLCFCNARITRKRSQSKAASLVGCSVEEYRLIEQGEKLPTLITFARLFDALGFDWRRAMRLLAKMSGEVSAADDLGGDESAHR